MTLCILYLNGAQFIQTVFLHRRECSHWASLWSLEGFSVWAEALKL